MTDTDYSLGLAPIEAPTSKVKTKVTVVLDPALQKRLEIDRVLEEQALLRALGIDADTAAGDPEHHRAFYNTAQSEVRKLRRSQGKPLEADEDQQQQANLFRQLIIIAIKTLFTYDLSGLTTKYNLYPILGTTRYLRDKEGGAELIEPKGDRVTFSLQNIYLGYKEDGTEAGLTMLVKDKHKRVPTPADKTLIYPWLLENTSLKDNMLIGVTSTGQKIEYFLDAPGTTYNLERETLCMWFAEESKIYAPEQVEGVVTE